MFPIEVPALRERRSDIPLLVEYFTHRYAKRLGKRIRSVTKETSTLLQSYDWPGNIRELQNVIERAVIVCDSDTLSIDARWLSGRSPARPRRSPASPPARWRPTKRTPSRLRSREARAAWPGPFGAAGRLGVPASTLESKIKALKIDKRRFKSGPAIAFPGISAGSSIDGYVAFAEARRPCPVDLAFRLTCSWLAPGCASTDPSQLVTTDDRVAATSRESRSSE